MAAKPINKLKEEQETPVTPPKTGETTYDTSTDITLVKATLALSDQHYEKLYTAIISHEQDNAKKFSKFYEKQVLTGNVRSHYLAEKLAKLQVPEIQTIAIDRPTVYNDIDFSSKVDARLALNGLFPRLALGEGSNE